MNRIIDSLINTIMTVWTMITTVVYTVTLGIPAMLVSLVSKTGILPFKIGRLWSLLLTRTNRVRIQVIGLEKFAREKSYVFISNHSSNLDPLGVAIAIPQTLRFIGKSSLAKIPILGWAAKLGRIIFIDRSNSTKAVETINKSIKDFRNGISAFFFAEGTRSMDGILQSFKKGGIVVALKAKLPIVPITIIDSHLILPKKSIRIRPGIIKIIIGDPIETKNYTDTDKDALLQKVRNVISETLRIYSTPNPAVSEA